MENIFYSLEVVIVNESQHADANLVEAIGRKVGCTMAVLVLKVKLCAAVESPGSVGGDAVLASVIDS